MAFEIVIWQKTNHTHNCTHAQKHNTFSFRDFSALSSTKIHQIWSDSEPVEVLFACGRLSTLPVFPDWVCTMVQQLFTISNTTCVKSWATAFSFSLLFGAVSWNKKAFLLLSCQRERLGQKKGIRNASLYSAYAVDIFY